MTKRAEKWPVIDHPTVLIISRAEPTAFSTNSVTCNGEYRRPDIEAQPSFHDGDAENGESECFLRLNVQTRTPFAVDPLEKMV